MEGYNETRDHFHGSKFYWASKNGENQWLSFSEFSVHIHVHVYTGITRTKGSKQSHIKYCIKSVPFQ